MLGVFFMTARDAVKTALASTKNWLNMYVADLSDTDFLVRPVPGANHIAWQMGQLIETEAMMSDQLGGKVYPPLPMHFNKTYGKDFAAIDTPDKFLNKADYVNLFNTLRDATIAAVGNMTDADLDKPLTGEMAQWAPTVGALLLLTADHTMMHAGQFTVIRRKLGKPVLF
jgi:hypothetical protein